MSRHPEFKKAKRQLARTFYRWHRRIGVSAALFVVWLVLTGWLLNHSDSLGMGTTELHSRALASWYGLTSSQPRSMYAAGDHWLIANDDNLILDGRAFGLQKMAPIGMAQTHSLVAIASDSFLMLLDHDGHLIDTLSRQDLPFTPIAQLGAGCNGIVIANASETLASSDGLEWKNCAEPISWSEPQAIPADKLAQLGNLLVPAISLEKLVVDLHTGRFFGRFGAYVVDAVGLCLLLLALSGLWLFFRMGKK